jgi:hypothetical protein
MTKQQVHARIRKKFGTLTRFARLTRFDRYELQKIFARQAGDQDLLKKLNVLVETTEAQASAVDISDEQRNKLKEIFAEKSVAEFCRENPKFKEDLIFQVMWGRRKRINQRVWELFTHLNIK